jgi:hypothetical protein
MFDLSPITSSFTKFNQVSSDNIFGYAGRPHSRWPGGRELMWCSCLLQVVEVGGGELHECMIFYDLGGHATKISGLVSSG